MSQEINSTVSFHVTTESDISGADSGASGAAAGSASTQPNLAVGVYNATLPTLADGEKGAVPLDNRTRLMVSPVETSKGLPSQGSATVATAGTAVALSATSVPLKTGVVLQWNPANTGPVYPGSSTVGNATSSFFLDGSSMPFFIEVDDLNKVYVNADNDGDSVLYFAT